MSKASSNSTYEKDAYLELLAASKRQVAATMSELLSWVDALDTAAASKFIALEPLIDIFPVSKQSEYVRTVFDIHTSAKRYGALGISLKSQNMRCDFANLSRAELVDSLKNYCSAEDAKTYSDAYHDFQGLMRRVAALRFLDVKFRVTASGGPVLPRWFDALQDYGKRCSPPLERAFQHFAELSEQLDEAIADFNSHAGPIRYRAIRFSFTLDELDPLGPSNPELKVISHIHPSTRQHRYNVMPDFKRQLRQRRVRKQLTKKLGRKPDKAEVAEGMAQLRNRKPSPWLTNEVIKACYLGPRSKDLLDAQTKLVAVIEPWSELRTKLKALL